MRIGELHSLLRQLVHVRRDRLRMTTLRSRPIIQVIDRDKEDIRFPRREARNDHPDQQCGGEKFSGR